MVKWRYLPSKQQVLSQDRIRTLFIPSIITHTPHTHTHKHKRPTHNILIYIIAIIRLTHTHTQTNKNELHIFWSAFAVRKKRLHPFINHCKTSLQNFLLAQEKVGASGERGNRVQIVFLRCSSISLTILFPQSYTNFHSPSQIYIYIYAKFVHHICCMAHIATS